MTLKSKLGPWLGAGAAVAIIGLTTAATYPQIAQAVDDTAATEQAAAPTDVTRGMRGVRGVHGEALAEALGISVDELEAAQEEARAAALEQAVTDGELTQEQADRIAERSGGRGMPGIYGSDELLAEALGISVDELEAAQAKVQADMLAQAVEDGRLTQEQADLMAARQAVQPYVQERLQSAYEEAVQAAVEAGAITQEQANALLSEERGFFERGRGFFGGDFDGGMRGGRHGGFEGRGGRGLEAPRPDRQSEDAPADSSSLTPGWSL